ncbi:hypothetical protein PRZ48_006840 [Zasmidium cellare]|uniref:Cytochrome P450 n=1 Tax=Zasmidium cellare TaxID=395010 RepID=A0ABR0EHP2_ZASCE|nr:hypothetical protein PRZ48_006840 [Zasmidium cellare]
MSPLIPTLLLGVLLIAYLFYRAAVPKPIPGIPYNVESLRPFGDLTAALKYRKKHRAMMTYFASKCLERHEPIMQFFFQPFARPLVVVCDQREGLDILTSRSREFDRSPLFSNLFRAVLPHSSIVMQTNDQWKYNRRLVSNTMSPAFLGSVGVSTAYSATMDMLDLWKRKAALLPHHVIDVKEDVFMSLVDVIWTVTFGSDLQVCKTQAKHLAALESIANPEMINGLTIVPSCKPPQIYDSLVRLFGSSQIALESPLGYKAHWLALKTSTPLRRAIKLRDALVSQQLHAAYQKFITVDTSASAGKAQSAVELVVQTEEQAARKDGRSPLDASTRDYIQDELNLFLFAGSSTTAEEVCWGLKLLTAHQDVQEKLRVAISDAFDSHTPTPTTLAQIKVPYLDAFVYETLRFGGNTQNTMRVSLVDTTILGHFVPKGTDIFVVNRDIIPHNSSCPCPVDESKRSPTSQASKKSTPLKWSHVDLNTFRPERWLAETTKGTEFSPQAVPLLTFGEGPRGCFGRRFAELEMRVLFTLIIWHFELLPIPAELEDFDPLEMLTMAPANCRVKLRESQ